MGLLTSSVFDLVLFLVNTKRRFPEGNSKAVLC